MASAGFDLEQEIKRNMAAGGFDLECVIRQSITAHMARKGCSFKEGAAEAIIASPEFSALANLLESYEICNAL